MIEDAIERFLDRFESLLLRQQRTAAFLLTESESLTIPLETTVDILKMNISVLESVSEITGIIYDVDDYLREKLWSMCSEAISWTSLVLISMDKSASVFLHHLNVKGSPLLYTLEKLTYDMHRDYQSVEIGTLQKKIEDIIRVLKQQVDLTIRSYSRVL